MDKKSQPISIPADKAKAIMAVRFMGLITLLFGAAVFFNLFGLAEAMGLAEDNLDQIIGGAFLLLGLVDIVLIPRLLEKAQTKR